MIGYKRILAGLALSLMSMVLYAQAPTVMVSTVSLQDFPLEVEALGNARANEAVDIRPKVTAMVTAIHFDEGQQVSAGDQLVTLENTEALADVAAARANLLDF